MTDKERIEALEKKVNELSSKLEQRKYSKPWQELCIEVELDKRLFEAFKTNDMNPRIAQTRAAISCIVGKSFCKDSVLNLDSEECKETKAFIEYILDFIKNTREKYTINNPARGYERKIDYKEECI